MKFEKVCSSTPGCIKCKSVVLLETFEGSAKKILVGSRKNKDKLAKIQQYMLKLCSHGELHTPEQFNKEISLIYDGHKANSYAIKAKPLRAYGWLINGVFFVSFLVEKKTEKLAPQDAEKIQREFEKFIEGNGHGYVL